MLQQIPPTLIQHGFQAEHLIDLTSHNPLCSSTRTLATIELWRSLLWSYPSATNNDCIPPANLLSEIHSRFYVPLHLLDASVPLSFHPNTKPSWLSNRFSIGISCHSDCVLLFLKGQPLKPQSPPTFPLPASLIIKLFQILSQLSLVARVNDRPTLRKLYSKALILLDVHPLKQELRTIVRKNPKHSALPQHLSREEYRSILLDEFAPLIDLLAGCDMDGYAYYLMVQNLEALRSPLNELLHVARSLLILATAVPGDSATISPFEDLNSMYATLLVLRKRDPHSSPAPHIPKMLSIHATTLLNLLPDRYASELSHYQQTIAVLQSMASAFPSGLQYPPQYHLHH